MASAAPAVATARDTRRAGPGGEPQAPAREPRRVPRFVWALPPVAVLAVVFLYPLALVVQQSVRPDEG
ncbi:hypothetical protein ACFWGZ_41320, partial [Lentzea sp. NPDC060358]